MPNITTQFFNSTGSLRAALAENRSFSHYDLNPAPRVLENLKGLRIEDQGNYDNFGSLGVLVDEMKRFFVSLGNEKKVSSLNAAAINELCLQTLEGFDAESAWIAARAVLPSASFDIPRWHMDGYFFEPFEGVQRKAVFVPKGPQTLMNDLPPSRRCEFNERSRLYTNDTDADRKKIMELVNQADTRCAAEGQGSIFAVGSEDLAGVHSEPPTHEKRFFFSIVPGTAKQIEELRQRWQSPLTSYNHG